jgi:hypothetical protein
VKSSLILALSFAAVILGFSAGWILKSSVGNASTRSAAVSGSATNGPSTGEEFPASLQSRSGTNDRDFTSRLDYVASLANPFKRARAIARIADDLNAAQVR